MSAVVLREAAQLMRDRASRAEARRWYPSDRHDGMDEVPWWEITADLPGDDDDPINEFVDSWHPVVALAVADYLEVTADTRECQMIEDHSEEFVAALAVARVYLGRDS